MATPDPRSSKSSRIAPPAVPEFRLLFQKDLRSNEQIPLNENVNVSPHSQLVLRVDPGPNGNEAADWLIWTQPIY
jgi:hypothetical protein